MTVMDTNLFVDLGRVPPTAVAARRSSFCFAFVRFSVRFSFEMPEGLYLLPISLVLVVAHPITGDSQEIIMGGKFSPEYPGWLLL